MLSNEFLSSPSLVYTRSQRECSALLTTLRQYVITTYDWRLKQHVSISMTNQQC